MQLMRETKFVWSLVTVLLMVAAMPVANAAWTPLGYDFSSIYADSDPGNTGNIIEIRDAAYGTSVFVSAWADLNTASFTAATVYDYGSGLGICNTADAKCPENNPIDNFIESFPGRFEFVRAGREECGKTPLQHPCERRSSLKKVLNAHCHGFADAIHIRFDVRIQKGLRHNFKSQTHHLLSDVYRVLILPTLPHPQAVFDHDRPILCQTLVMEGGLYQAPLAVMVVALTC